ncbi:MAG TPA: glucokinase, partial [Massilia timonae]|nr:glucokinase [Massilia timonae]
QYAWREFEHVSFERFLSGAGVELIYRALADRAGRPDERLDAAEISRRALSGECALCDEVLEAFCGMLGTVAGNLAVTLGAQGGVYIGGGI